MEVKCGFFPPPHCVVCKPEKRRDTFRGAHESSVETMQNLGPFTHPFLRLEESPLCNLIDMKHAAMHLHTENKCDTIGNWRDAQ